MNAGRKGKPARDRSAEQAAVAQAYLGMSESGAFPYDERIDRQPDEPGAAE